MHVLSLTHFGKAKLCGRGLHIELEWGYMWPTADVFTCTGTFPAVQTRALGKSLICYKYVVTLLQKHHVIQQKLREKHAQEQSLVCEFCWLLCDFSFESFQECRTVSFIGLKVCYFSDAMQCKARQQQQTEGLSLRRQKTWINSIHIHVVVPYFSSIGKQCVISLNVK